MRNKQDFEQLVFERADKLKAHDRSMKIVRISVMPIAAAFVVLTAVGLRGLSNPSYMNATNAADNAAAGELYEYSAGNTAAANDLEAEPRNQAEINAAKSYEEDFDAVQDADEYNDDVGADVQNENTAAAQTQTSAVVFRGQQTQTVTGETAVSEITSAFDALSEPSDSSAGGCLGYIEFRGDTETQYRIYADRVEKYTGGTLTDSFAMTNDVKRVLAKYFNIDLGS